MNKNMQVSLTNKKLVAYKKTDDKITKGFSLFQKKRLETTGLWREGQCRRERTYRTAASEEVCRYYRAQKFVKYVIFLQKKKLGIFPMILLLNVVFRWLNMNFAVVSQTP